GAEVVDVPAGALRRWQDDGRTEVFGDGEYGVMVEYDGPVTATEAAWSGGGRVPLKVELTDTAETAGTLPGSADRAREWAAARAAREAERAALLASKTNAWVGVEGERRTFTGTIRSAATHRGDYGYYQVVVIDTAEGAVKILGRVSWPTEMPDAELAGRTTVTCYSSPATGSEVA